MVPTMSTVTVITVTWMDGKVEVYHNVVTHRVADGVLTIEGFDRPHSLADQFYEHARGRQPVGRTTLHLVLANIREYTVEERPKL